MFNIYNILVVILYFDMHYYELAWFPFMDEFNILNRTPPGHRCDGRDPFHKKTAPVTAGTVLIHDLLGLGTDVPVTRDVPAL